jgi:hypothetical protein
VFVDDIQLNETIIKWTEGAQPKTRAPYHGDSRANTFKKQQKQRNMQQSMTGFRTITSYFAAKESAVDSSEIPSLRSSTLKEQIDECLLAIKKKTAISPNQ